MTKEEQEQRENFIQSEINKVYELAKKTKFNDRLSHIRNNNRISFYLDEKKITDIDEGVVVSFYCVGDLGRKIIKECYSKEGFYELNLFIDKYCIVFDKPVPIFCRISRENFINQYCDFLYNELKSDKKINFNKLSTILTLNYNEKFVRNGSKYWLTHITFKRIIKENFFETDSETNTKNDLLLNNSLSTFIDKYCVISNNIKPTERITRQSFKIGYKSYCEQINCAQLDYKSMKQTLKEKYNESFIKSNGTWYMSKIKFRSFK